VRARGHFRAKGDASDKGTRRKIGRSPSCDLTNSDSDKSCLVLRTPPASGLGLRALGAGIEATVVLAYHREGAKN
jgi:hypothetical protein